VTDAELILASRRDPLAFRELYDRWADRLLAYFYRRTLDAEVAADLLAESIARIEALADIEQHREALAAALDQMTGGEREAVHLRVVAELGYAEIAARLDCTEGAARRRVHRGLARLNHMMQMEATP
jgi:RNA polymerase sigma factor (sigma-70 family)